jgi:hypothetical protein
MSVLRRFSETLARTTSRRGLFGRGADVAFGLLAGAAAGQLAGPSSALAGGATRCAFPGPPCQCDKCLSNGVCAKPCVILTYYYASGCWVAAGNITCCDCDCHGIGGIGWCGCGSDYHNNPQFCP